MTMELDISNFEDAAKRAVEWIKHYMSHMNEYPVMAKAKPGDIKSKLPVLPPAEPETLTSIMNDFESIVIPGITHWNHPRFFAYFSITSSYAGIIGELLATTLNVNAMNWKSSPSATELEEVVLDWLRQMVSLPDDFMGIINDTASVSSLCAVAAARESLKLDIRERGLAGRTDMPRLTIYISEETHSSVEKAAIVLGIGQENVRKISTNSKFQMNTQELEEKILSDLKNGAKPVCVIATIGTTSTTSVDPVSDIVRICKKYDIWLHIDAAYGGPIAIVPEKKEYFKDWERADSIVINPHKWLFTPIDCSVLFCRQPDILKNAFSLVPEYLKTSEQDDVINYMDYGVALGRRFRSLKLWFIIRAYGVRKLRNILRNQLEYAQIIKSRIEMNENFELIAPVPFSTIVFRLNPNNGSNEFSDDDLNIINEKLLYKINETGEVFLSHTKLNNLFSIRFAIGNIKTTLDDVQFAWEIITEKAMEILNDL